MSEESCESKHESCSPGCSCNCGCECCGGGHHFHRHFQTKAEQIIELEAYLVELKREVQAVEERLSDLRKER